MKAVPRSKSAVISFLSCILLLGLLPTRASAQFNSGFTGVIVEQTGAVVPGAKIIVTNQDTHISQYAISTDSGDFRVSSLPGGMYTIEVEAQGHHGRDGLRPRDDPEVGGRKEQVRHPQREDEDQHRPYVQAAEPVQAEGAGEASPHVC